MKPMVVQHLHRQRRRALPYSDGLILAADALDIIGSDEQRAVRRLLTFVAEERRVKTDLAWLIPRRPKGETRTTCAGVALSDPEHTCTWWYTLKALSPVLQRDVEPTLSYFLPVHLSELDLTDAPIISTRLQRRLDSNFRSRRNKPEAWPERARQLQAEEQARTRAMLAAHADRAGRIYTPEDGKNAWWDALTKDERTAFFPFSPTPQTERSYALIRAAGGSMLIGDREITDDPTLMEGAVHSPQD